MQQGMPWQRILLVGIPDLNVDLDADTNECFDNSSHCDEC